MEHYHGGQDIYEMKNEIIQDMSVTTNGLGPNSNWKLENYYELINHYPPINDIELLNSYNDFVKLNTKNVLFGNGATELIDLLIRDIPSGNWKTNNVSVQYAEYANSCKLSNRQKCDYTDMNVILTIIVNPNNPTGEFLNWENMKGFLDTYVPDNSFLIVDESMLFWYGPDWTTQSFLGHIDYCDYLLQTRNIEVFIIQSWTKIFSCTGLRFGSLYIHDDSIFEKLKFKQTPWSVNVIARNYILYCWKDQEYLNKTWELNKNWRKTIIDNLQKIYKNWKFNGEDFISWIWINVGNEKLADKIVNISRDNGFPVRHGKYGYNCPKYIRIGVRDPEKINKWIDIIKNQPFGDIFLQNMIPPNIIIKNEVININNIKIHENVVTENMIAFEQYLTKSQNYLIPSILVSEEMVLIDGHHRLELLKKMGYNQIPVTIIDYHNPIILTHNDHEKQISKELVINTALSGNTLPPKTTRHILCIDKQFVPISILSTNVSLCL